MKKFGLKPCTAKLLFLGTALLFSHPTLAGGVQKVSDFTDNILAIFHAISLTVVIIALTWTGYKFMYQHASMGECAKILGGGLLIGGAAELAAYLVV
jgi:hypothetical protein